MAPEGPSAAGRDAKDVAPEAAEAGGGAPSPSDAPDAEAFFARRHESSWSAGDLAPTHARAREPAPTPESLRARRLFWAAWGATIGLVLANAVLHFLPFARPQGLETHLLSLAAIGLFASVTLWHQGRWSPSLAGAIGTDGVLAAHRAKLWLLGLGVAFGVEAALLAVLEFLALLVGLGAWEIRDSGSVLFVSNYVLFLTLVLAVPLIALWVRTRVPSTEPEATGLPLIERVTLGVFLAATAIASFLSAGVPGVEAATGVAPRQAIYVASLGLIPLAILANLKLRIPHALAIIRREIDESKHVTRRNADVLRRRVIRSYVLSLGFIGLSLAFLVANLTGVLDFGTTAGGDVMLALYIVLGLIFVSLAAIAFFQSRNFQERVGRRPGAAGVIPEKKYTKEELNRTVFLSLSASLAGLFFLAGVLVLTGIADQFGSAPIDKDVSTDLFVAAFLGGVGPYGYFYVRETNRIRAIDEKFPDFLRDLAESQRAGMTLPRALVTAARGTYGALTPEIQKMAAQVEWGVPFTSALERFADRCRTPLIERTVSLVVEASNSGGNVVDVLGAASDDAREIKNIMWERKSQMGIYAMIIYIAFFVFIAVVAILNAQFIPQLAAATGAVAGTSVGGLTFGVIDVEAYQRLFLHASLIQGIGGGLVSGVMTDGHPMAGLKHSFIMVVIGYVLFRFLIL